jgi:hypothetical protein
MWWKWGHMQRCAIISFCPGFGYGPRRRKVNFTTRFHREREKEKKKCENQHCNPITNIRWHRDPNFVSTQIFQDLAGFVGLRVCLGIEPGYCCLCALALMDDFHKRWKGDPSEAFLFVCVCGDEIRKGEIKERADEKEVASIESENGCSISSCIWPSSR